jgi:hypothetical protein
MGARFGAPYCRTNRETVPTILPNIDTLVAAHRLDDLKI